MMIKVRVKLEIEGYLVKLGILPELLTHAAANWLYIMIATTQEIRD